MGMCSTLHWQSHALTPGSEECFELGFTQELQCSTCDRLRDFLPSDEQKGAKDAVQLLDECESCCKPEVEEIFERAVFYVCPGHTQADQHLKDFVEKRSKGIAALQIKGTYHACSVLQLIRQGESEMTATETMRVAGWKSEEIEDLVLMKLGLPRV